MPPAEIIQGEAGTCIAYSLAALIAVAYVWQRNKTMYGWDDDVSSQALFVSLYWDKLPDPTEGAVFLFSESDLEDKRVQELIRGRGPPVEFECKGDNLYAY